MWRFSTIFWNSHFSETYRHWWPFHLQISQLIIVGLILSNSFELINKIIEILPDLSFLVWNDLSLKRNEIMADGGRLPSCHLLKQIQIDKAPSYLCHRTKMCVLTLQARTNPFRKHDAVMWKGKSEDSFKNALFLRKNCRIRMNKRVVLNLRWQLI